MTPAMMRAAILVTELVVFFMVTAFMTYFISHASALQFGQGEAPPADFPVIAYAGDRLRPDGRNYAIVPWNEWESGAGKRPGASLLLPERSASIRIGDAGQASFDVVEAGDSRQTVELTWRTEGSEQLSRYVAHSEGIEPRYFRVLGTRTFLMGALAGFGVGLLVGRALRRRFLVQPRFVAPPQQG